jgi:hypothetical protein
VFNKMSHGSKHWVSVRERQRGDGSTSFNNLYRLDGKQRSQRGGLRRGLNNDGLSFAEMEQTQVEKLQALHPAPAGLAGSV